jgi:hypothetical protein
LANLGPIHNSLNPVSLNMFHQLPNRRITKLPRSISLIIVWSLEIIQRDDGCLLGEEHEMDTWPGSEKQRGPFYNLICVVARHIITFCAEFFPSPMWINIKCMRIYKSSVCQRLKFPRNLSRAQLRLLLACFAEQLNRFMHGASRRSLSYVQFKIVYCVLRNKFLPHILRVDQKLDNIECTSYSNPHLPQNSWVRIEIQFVANVWLTYQRRHEISKRLQICVCSADDSGAKCYHV